LDLGFVHGDVRGQAPLLAVGARGVVFLGAGLALGVVLVETGQLRPRRLDLPHQRLDLGIGDVLFVALAHPEAGLMKIRSKLVK